MEDRLYDKVTEDHYWTLSKKAGKNIIIAEEKFDNTHNAYNAKSTYCKVK